LNKYIEKFGDLSNSSIEVAPKTIREFVEKYIVSKFDNNYQDYIEFVSKYHCISIGNVYIPSNTIGYVYFSFYPIENTFDFNDPFEDDYFLFAESEEEYHGTNKNLSFYLSLSNNRKKGVYCAIYEENKKLKYNLLYHSFTDFMEQAIKNEGRFVRCVLYDCL